MDTNFQELLKYDWINFYDNRTNCRDKKSGAKIGKYFAISGYKDKWQIYNVFGGVPVLDCWINSLDDAVKIYIARCNWNSQAFSSRW
jgi:hypothetical protein